MIRQMSLGIATLVATHEPPPSARMAHRRKRDSMAAMAQHTRATARVPHAGDIIEVQGLPGYPPRRGQIVEVLGSHGQPHYRVRWDEQHESLYFPADGALRVVPAARRPV